MKKLSYSSLKLIQSCPTRYYHYKVVETPQDSDYEESDALGLGKAFHEVLEKSFHRSAIPEHVNEAVIKYNVDHKDHQLLKKMLEKYVAFHNSGNLDVVICELPIETPEYLGFIDAIAVDEDLNGFWIIDLKTSARFDESLLPRLAKDMQMNLYAKFAEDMHLAHSKLKGKKFLGCRYRITTKSKAVTEKGLESGVKVYDIEIPVEVLNPKEAWSVFQDVLSQAVSLQNGEAPSKNYEACISYFKPCPYFSQCHGKTFTEAKNLVKVHTLESITDGDLL
jgi:hypothetical protein